MTDNVLTFGTFHLLVSEQPLIPVSFCQVWWGCQFLSLPLCSVHWGLQDCRCTACLPTTGGPKRERAHISPSSWLIKTFSCSSPSSSLIRLLTPRWSHQSSFDLQYLHHPPVPIVATGNLRNGPPLPALSTASILLNVSQSVVVGGVPSHRALLPFGSLPCGGSDHSAVLTTRDLAPQPTVIEVTSQAIPWWIIKRPETELRVT